MTTTYYPYKGSGKIYGKVEGVTGGLIEFGNASKLEFAAKEEKKTLKDFTSPGGGSYASLTKIDSVSVAMTLHDLNKENLAKVLFGTASSVNGGTVTDEVVTAYKGALIKLAHMQPTSVVVTNSAASTTYVANTDYEVRAGGIFILSAGAITDAQSLKVDYTYAAYDKVEALTASSVILNLYFEGLNEANSGKPVIVDAYRVQLSPTKALALLGENFAGLDVDGEVLQDPAKTGVGISKYFKVDLA
jgi:hypothetical protein